MNFISAGLEKVGDLAHGAADMVSGASVKPFKDAASALSSMQDELTGSLDQANRTRDLFESVNPREHADKATEVFKALPAGVTSAVDGDAKKLLPPGGSCIAGYYISSVRTKLRTFGTETQTLAKDLVEKPQQAAGEIMAMSESSKHLTMAFGCVTSVLSETVSAVESIAKDPTQAQYLDQKITDLDTRLKEQIGGARAAIDAFAQAITSKPVAAVQAVEDLCTKIDRFKVSAPKKVMKCFKPPKPCCCAGSGKMGEAQETLEGILEAVSNAVSLDTLFQGLKTMKDSLTLITLDDARNTLETVEAKFTEIMAPVREAASKMGGLRGAASGE